MPAESSFCPWCGKSGVMQQCSRCKENILQGAPFCGKCGLAIGHVVLPHVNVEILARLTFEIKKKEWEEKAAWPFIWLKTKFQEPILPESKISGSVIILCTNIETGTKEEFEFECKYILRETDYQEHTKETSDYLIPTGASYNLSYSPLSGLEEVINFVQDHYVMYPEGNSILDTLYNVNIYTGITKLTSIHIIAVNVTHTNSYSCDEKSYKIHNINQKLVNITLKGA